MSAFIVSTNVMTEIRNKILSNKLSHRPTDILAVEKTVNDMVLSWAKMNRYAIKCRYGDQVKPMKLTPWDQTISSMSDIQLYKHLECLKYQCSENYTEIKHKTAWHTLQTMMVEVANTIISSMSEYNDAEWG